MPDDQDVIDKISGVLRSMSEPISGYDGKIVPETSIVRDLKLDSLAVMDFVMALETSFDTIIPIDELSRVETIGDLARLLQAQSGSSSHSDPAV